MRQGRSGDSECVRLVADPLRLDVPADSLSVGRVRRAVCRYARRAGITDVAAVGLAVSETVTNAVVHAYRDCAVKTGIITVEAHQPEGNGLIVRVVDFGGGLVPRHDSPGIGLGLPLIARLTESFEIHDQPTGTLVELRFAA